MAFRDVWRCCSRRLGNSRIIHGCRSCTSTTFLHLEALYFRYAGIKRETPSHSFSSITILQSYSTKGSGIYLYGPVHARDGAVYGLAQFFAPAPVVFTHACIKDVPYISRSTPHFAPPGLKRDRRAFIASSEPYRLRMPPSATPSSGMYMYAAVSITSL